MVEDIVCCALAILFLLTPFLGAFSAEQERAKTRKETEKVVLSEEVRNFLEDKSGSEVFGKKAEYELRKRKPISQNVKDKVWNRDGGRCVECGSKEKLEFDHIIPLSKGGASTYRNIQLLCEHCNRSKSDRIG
tara:strand:- start:327 stop:725 length:399 start_codon:yes stop_codon:yes gene_type:complete